MANEQAFNVTATLTNGSLKDLFNPGQILRTQGLAGAMTRTIAVTTADTAYTFSDITTLGYMMLLNMDATNYVAHGPTSGGAIINYGKLKPGDFAIFRAYPGISFRMQADTATCNVLCKVWND